MGQKKWYGIAAVCLIIVCVAVLAVVLPKKMTGPTPPGQTPSTGSGNQTLEKEGYISDVPANATVTIPIAEAPAAPNATEKFRVYDISVTKDGYSPDTITVNKGDVVQLNLTAVDGAYDFSMPYTGLSQSLLKGETKQVGFGATSEGTFEFRCDKLCPDAGTIRGQLVVLP